MVLILLKSTCGSTGKNKLEKHFKLVGFIFDLLDEDVPEEYKNVIREELLKKGIETGIHYKPIHNFSLYKSKIKLPITEKVGKEIVTLPTHPNITKKDLEKIYDF